jgi:hypothetical protein
MKAGMARPSLTDFASTVITRIKQERDYGTIGGSELSAPSRILGGK